MPRKKDRKPQAGETVYLKGDVRCTPMYLDRIYKRDNVEYGFCFWTAYELFDEELISKEKEQEFLLEELTVYATP
jgi:hypothetical protein